MDRYLFRYQIIPSRNWCVYELQRNPKELPFVVIVRGFSNVGHRQFFNDIFSTGMWDTGRSEVKSLDGEFCCKLWNYFLLDRQYGEFQPWHLSLPCGSNPPLVYRNTVEKLLKILEVDNLNCKIYDVKV